ncbi:phytoene desaturase family protein [Meiothermus granaticius]|uniref:phytoene desaturase family protein n=2 Tax=Meiothermus granaticius TaxID=863370 RepID=UPI0011BE2080|nr:FAD-dependent oxidoreductase [Meiothermus granaticius]
MRAVVIGAGFAGLAAALRLRKAGLETVVLEKQPAPGGKAIGWEGVPTGPTVLTLPEVIREIFAAFGATAPALYAVSPLSRYRWPDGREFAPELDLEATLSQLSSQEAQSYRRLLEEARRLYEGASPTFIFSDPPTLPALTRYGLGAGLRAHPLMGLPRLVESGPHLTPFFLRFATYLGANPYKAPAVLHNIAWVELGLGVYALEGGMRALADALYGLAKAQGVEFSFGTEVVGLETAQDPGGRPRVREVRTAAGGYEAEWVVSAADRHFTLAWLKKPLPTYELGVSGFAVLMRLSERQPLGHWLYFSPDYAGEWRELASGRLASDPTLYLHTDGEAAFLLVNAPSLQVMRSETLRAKGQNYARLLMRKLRRLHPLPIAEWRVMSPLEYTATSYQGALYGRAPHGLWGSLRPGWSVGGWANLAQVGGTVHPGGGVPLALLSGWRGVQWLLNRWNP